MNVDDAQSIFVRNLPFSATTRDLEELCGGIGPVKRASIIQSADGVSRGFGFVKFAIPEDAVRAAAILASTDLKGRTLSVELAVKRGQKPAHAPQISTAKGGKVKDSKKPAKEEPQDDKEAKEDVEGKQKKLEEVGAGHSEAAARPTASKGTASTASASTNKRGKAAAATSSATTTQKKKPGHALLSSQPSKTLIVFNLASQTTEKQLYKRVKKIETPKSIKTETIDGSARVAILVFDTPAAAKKVQKKLDQHTIHGQKLSLRPFHPGDKNAATVSSAGDGEVGVSRTVSDISQMRGQAKRNNRLIIRNLSFKATEDDLKDALSAFGPVLEASIPQVNVRGVEGRRGFGFVTFACAEDAMKAIKHEGGLKVRGREVAVDMCMGRREYQQEKQKTTAAAEATSKKDDPNMTPTSPAGGGDPAEADDESVTHESEEEMEDSEERDDDDDEDKEEDDDGDDDGDEDAHDEEEMDEESEGEDGGKADPKPSDVKEGKTVFLRNIPFDATPESLKMAFHDYAPVAFAIIVKDRATGMSKGTAFVKFKTTQGMDIVLDAAAAAGGSLTLLGRDLKVDRAMEREDAPQAKVPGTNPDGSTSNEITKSKADRRNLYLANEGLVVDSEAQDEIPKSDLEKRKREQAEKKTKLRNPFFFVSPTRLSIRNLGRTVLDNDLRALLVQSVQKGLEAEKVTSEDLKMHLRAQGLYEQASDPKCLVVLVPRPRDIHVKVKVMRDLDKKPEDGVYPSRGYGFADFSSHVHALAALRQVNNNPAFASYAIKAGGGKRSRLIVSFAVENHKALQKKILRGEVVKTAAAPEAKRREPKEAVPARGKRKLADREDGKEDEKVAADSAEKKLSRGQRQRELKRQRKAEGGDEGPARRTRTGAIVGKLGKAAAALHQRSEKRTPASAEGKDKLGRLPPQQPEARGSRGARGGTEEQGEDELTRLAAAAATGGEANKKGRRKSGVQKESNEDKQFVQTVNAYKQKLLGGGAVGAGAGGAGKGGEEEKKGKGKSERWFE